MLYRIMLEESMLNFVTFDVFENKNEKSLILTYANDYFKKSFFDIDNYTNKDFFCDILNVEISKQEINEIINKLFSQKKYSFKLKNGKNIYLIKFYLESEKKICGVIDVLKNEENKKNDIDFIANLSHELRTPINLILSCLQVVDMKVKKSVCSLEFDVEKINTNCFLENSEFEKYLKMIKQNSLRLLRLVNNLIDSNKIEYGKFDYNPKNYDIINVVENMCMSTAEFIKNKGLEIIFDTNCEEQIVCFDIDSMERIILNLISNASKFNKPNGKIEVFINCEQKKDIKISVKDSGYGIEKEKLGKIFERFEQIKDNEKREKQGSGIGLSLVKSLVEMQGGKIEVESEVNVGTTFTVCIPNKRLDDEELFNLIDREIFENDSKIDNMKLELADIY